MYLITLHPGQLPVDVLDLHLVPGKAVPVETVPAEVHALRPRVKMTIEKTRPIERDDGPERESPPDLDGDGVPDAPVEPEASEEAPAATGPSKRRRG